MENARLLNNQQLILGGVGGQGILFLTRLLAEAAILRGLPVLSSETHGMAQRGGIVVSHLKVGEFSSPLVRSGKADGMLALRGENLAEHGSFLRTGGWAALNSPSVERSRSDLVAHAVDADRIAMDHGAPQTVNLILLGFVLSENSPFPFFCTAENITTVLEKRMAGKGSLRERSLRAFAAGLEQGRLLFG